MRNWDCADEEAMPSFGCLDLLGLRKISLFDQVVVSSLKVINFGM